MQKTKEFGYIYMTENSITGRIYIGKREGNFDPNYFGSGLYLKRALNKFNRCNFKVSILVFGDSRQELNGLEKYFIAKYRKKLGERELYNLSAGGTGGNVYKDGCPSRQHREVLRARWLGDSNPMKNEEIAKRVGLTRLGENNPNKVKAT